MESESLVMLVSGAELMGIERIREALFKAGFRVIAVEASDTQRALLDQKPSLIIANLTGVDAADLELCWVIRRLNPAPIVAIGPGMDEAFRVGMLELIVDDYLNRPVSPRELVARVRSILRRTGRTAPKEEQTCPIPPERTGQPDPRPSRGSIRTLLGRLWPHRIF